MPFARLTYHPPHPDRERDLARALTDLIATDLAKRHDLTSVQIESTLTKTWTIGGELQPGAAHLEVFVTAGTNTVEQKRAFLNKAMALLRAEWPELHPATYVVVQELPATDWGYDGLSQADRAAAR
ncbi:MAG: 4-oxalocrotonate tautomerase family protein [Agrobacterium tumefaciens]|jgi:4-oxalocrotonate tautomerase